MFTPTLLPAIVESRSVTAEPVAAFTPVVPTRRISTRLSTAVAVPAVGATLIPAPLEPAKSEISVPETNKAALSFGVKATPACVTLRMTQFYMDSDRPLLN